MTAIKLHEILTKGEGIDVEFKTSHFELNKNVFETICGFLNRDGGHLLLGVKDNGTVEGVMEACVQEIVNNIVTSANNHFKLSPPFYLSPKVIEYEGKKVIYVYVPESSQVHSTNGKIFDRNQDGDFDVTRNTNQVTQLYLRKQTTYTENRVFPFVELADFKPELFKRIRVLAQREREGHPWTEMNDEELLRSSGFYKTDPFTGKPGYTLAGILLLGKDLTILDALPHHKTDAILRKENLDRYDDRDDIRINLIESYDRLMAFVAKHLSDKFYQEKEDRISLRDRLFREVVSNLLIHREFSNGFPAKFIIQKEQVYTENWSLPRGGGDIDPANFSPFPKNPLIARFFREIGRVDELGSGVKNVFKYTSIYSSGAEPKLIEGDVFKAIIPLNAEQAVKLNQIEWDIIKTKFEEKLGERLGEKLGERLGEKLGENEQKILEILWNGPNTNIPEMAKILGISITAVENNIRKLRQKQLLERVGPAKGGYWKINLDN